MLIKSRHKRDLAVWRQRIQMSQNPGSSNDFQQRKTCLLVRDREPFLSVRINPTQNRRVGQVVKHHNESFGPTSLLKAGSSQSTLHRFASRHNPSPPNLQDERGTTWTVRLEGYQLHKLIQIPQANVLSPTAKGTLPPQHLWQGGMLHRTQVLGWEGFAGNPGVMPSSVNVQGDFASFRNQILHLSLSFVYLEKVE